MHPNAPHFFLVKQALKYLGENECIALFWVRNGTLQESSARVFNQQYHHWQQTINTNTIINTTTTTPCFWSTATTTPTAMLTTPKQQQHNKQQQHHRQLEVRELKPQTA